MTQQGGDHFPPVHAASVPIVLSPETTSTQQGGDHFPPVHAASVPGGQPVQQQQQQQSSKVHGIFHPRAGSVPAQRCTDVMLSPAARPRSMSPLQPHRARRMPTPAPSPPSSRGRSASRSSSSAGGRAFALQQHAEIARLRELQQCLIMPQDQIYWDLAEDQIRTLDRQLSQ